MNKNDFAITPPMGWNSFDYYDTTVNEENVKANADYMAAHLKQSGWEYIVVDIEWYAYGVGSRRAEYQYIPFGKVAMDEYSRLIPCEERFPSAKDGAGFKPLADYVHSLGLKFGIHIMRGIPRIAAHLGTAIKGTDATASDLANAYSICPWNPDMYGVDVTKKDAQLYYDSIMELYASWGVDFVKCDDICRYDSDTAEQEIIMLHNAILKCGRPIVFSLSPGPAIAEKSWIYEKYANMWRITDDMWDKWEHIVNMFDRCEVWQNHVSQGCYPDCDMLPVGVLGKGFDDERMSNLTPDEQHTLMTLWCIFRSPLMIGTDLPQLDEPTLALLTNADVLRVQMHSHGARQVRRDAEHAVWASVDDETDDIYIALFNLDEKENTILVSTEEIKESLMYAAGVDCDKIARILNADIINTTELWSKEECKITDKELNCTVAAHGARIYRLFDTMFR